MTPLVASMGLELALNHERLRQYISFRTVHTCRVHTSVRDELETPERRDCGYGETRRVKQRNAMVGHRCAADRCVTVFSPAVLNSIRRVCISKAMDPLGNRLHVDCRVMDDSAVDTGTLERMRLRGMGRPVRQLPVERSLPRVRIRRLRDVD